MVVMLLKFVRSVAVSPHSLSATAAYSPALLALKRFVRGVLKQFGIGLVSLMVILSISAHSSASVLPDGDDFKAERLSSSASTVHVQLQRTLSSAAQHSSEPMTATSEPSTAKSELSPSLRASMLRHPMTGARLSIPESGEQAIPLEGDAIANLSEAK